MRDRTMRLLAFLIDWMLRMSISWISWEHLVWNPGLPNPYFHYIVLQHQDHDIQAGWDWNHKCYSSNMMALSVLGMHLKHRNWAQATERQRWLCSLQSQVGDQWMPFGSSRARWQTFHIIPGMLQNTESPVCQLQGALVPFWVYRQRLHEQLALYLPQRLFLRLYYGS